MSRKISYLAYYLPQYHPIPENDQWWEPGFTEWTNVTKAKPLFKGHLQPHLPSELGFYDLRIPDVQQKQSELALEYGLDGFIYYQYWFGDGKMLLEKPAENMLKNPKIKIPFCFCWANESWRGVMHGLNPSNTLIEQTYPGEQDYRNYFYYLLPFFNDYRYIKVDDRPMFHIYKLDDIPDLDIFTSTFEILAKEHGFPGIYFVATGNVNSKKVVKNDSISAVVGLDIFKRLRYNKLDHFKKGSILYWLNKQWDRFPIGKQNLANRRKPLVLDYDKWINRMSVSFPHPKYISCLLPNWDNSPRSGPQSLVIINTSPSKFEIALKHYTQNLLSNPRNPRFIIIKSWNEWAEGNYLEPDRAFGRGWLEAIAKGTGFSEHTHDAQTDKINRIKSTV
jgi:hypothetical protein